MQIICVEEVAFFALIDQVIEQIKTKKSVDENKWISGLEAMDILRIKSKTTLQKLRDEGKIRFSQPEKRIILYDRDSIREYLDDFVYETF
jgi:hypothetical protein